MPTEDLNCAEYCFQCCLNPLQDSSLDENIHHRDVLLTALSDSCGGLVFQTTAAKTPHKTIEFSTFTHSSLSTSSKVERSQLAVHDNVWSVIAAKKSEEVALYKLDRDEVEVKIDIHGKVRYMSHSGEAPGIVENPAHERVQQNPKAAIDLNGASTESSQPPAKKPRVDDVDSSKPPSAISELNWDQNKGNWWGILRRTKE